MDEGQKLFVWAVENLHVSIKKNDNQDIKYYLRRLSEMDVEPEIVSRCGILETFLALERDARIRIDALALKLATLAEIQEETSMKSEDNLGSNESNKPSVEASEPKSFLKKEKRFRFRIVKKKFQKMFLSIRSLKDRLKNKYL